MPTVTVLEKLYGSIIPATFEERYSGLVRGLKVQMRFVGTTDRGWIQLDVSGDDQTVALSLLDREVGLAPVSLDGLEKFSVMQGKVIFSNKSKDNVRVDVGAVFSQTCDAVVSKNQLGAQLADGKELSLQRLVELFCLYDNVPLQVKILEKAGENCKTVEAALSEAQLSIFKSWVHSRFDRLIILGSLMSDVERAVKLSRHSRDIIKTESLGTLEQVVLCKLGTDAVGLIPKLGRYLKSGVLVPFSPKKILEAVGSQTFDY
ncbi:MAG: hypothetical protein CW691_03785 [Candidatus Bathyarchaeum sp.]|nr:MAG: hypothetical protein CW691_03785 [Candidatus Bathyarchaeum sp.]